MPKTITVEIPDGYELIKTPYGFALQLDDTWCKTWAECVKKFSKDNQVFYIDSASDIHCMSEITKVSKRERNLLPSEAIAKVMLILGQLLIAREVYRNGWEPDWNDNSEKHVIVPYRGKLSCHSTCSTNSVLAFQTIEIRDEFFKNFKKLIIEAQELL